MNLLSKIHKFFYSDHDRSHAIYQCLFKTHIRNISLSQREFAYINKLIKNGIDLGFRVNGHGISLLEKVVNCNNTQLVKRFLDLGAQFDGQRNPHDRCYNK